MKVIKKIITSLLGLIALFILFLIFVIVFCGAVWFIFKTNIPLVHKTQNKIKTYFSTPAREAILCSELYMESVKKEIDRNLSLCSQETERFFISWITINPNSLDATWLSVRSIIPYISIDGSKTDNKPGEISNRNPSLYREVQIIDSMTVEYLKSSANSIQEISELEAEESGRVLVQSIFSRLRIFDLLNMPKNTRKAQFLISKSNNSSLIWVFTLIDARLEEEKQLNVDCDVNIKSPHHILHNIENFIVKQHL